MSDSETCKSPEKGKVAKAVVRDLVPAKSSAIYKAKYDKFINWCHNKQVKTYSENVLLAYFSELLTVQKMKSSTLLSQYSIIKTLLNIKHGVDISQYVKLHTFLREKHDGYVPKKSKAFTKEQFERFVFEAPDEKYLAMKVVLIIGISGACKCDELRRMKTTDFEDLGSLLHIQIPDSKTKKVRSFTVIGEKFANFYRNYLSLRPTRMKGSRFFLNYTNGKCKRSAMGIHTIGEIGRKVASYLKLENWMEYTGHCLRRTSATLPIDGGVDIACLKRNGGWKSSGVDEGLSPNIKSELPETSSSNSNEEESMLDGFKHYSIYKAKYDKFIDWCNNKRVQTYSENVLLAYFAELVTKQKVKSSNLWSQYSMIKSLLKSKHGVDISQYFKLRNYLKKKNEGLVPKKLKAFSKEQFERFVFEAPDEKYLATKVLLIIGVFGACKRAELLNMKTTDIEDLGSLLHIKIPDGKTKKVRRSFTVVGEKFVNVYRSYISLRPTEMDTSRFFLRYANGQCQRSAMGSHTFRNVGKNVASYLKLQGWKDYTGHCIRRTSAVLLKAGKKYEDE